MSQALGCIPNLQDLQCGGLLGVVLYISLSVVGSHK